MPNEITAHNLAFVIACAALAGCAQNTARVARAAPADLAGSAPPGLGTPRPTPVVTAYDGAYAGALVPDPRNPSRCGPDRAPVARSMLVANGHATLGVNLPFAGTVQPDGRLVLRYLNVGTITGQFDRDAFAGVVRLGAPRCHWALGLARAGRPTEPAGLALGVSPAPGLVPEAAPANAAGLPGDPFAQPLPPPPTGACAPAALGNCR